MRRWCACSSPFAPHMAEELWERPRSCRRHRRGRLARVTMRQSPRPSRSSCPVQINGKVRARMTVAADTSEDRPAELALAEPQVRAASRGQDGEKGRRGSADGSSALLSDDQARSHLRRRGRAAGGDGPGGAAAIRWPDAVRFCRLTSSGSACRSSSTARLSSSSTARSPIRSALSSSVAASTTIVPDATGGRRACSPGRLPRSR